MKVLMRHLRKKSENREDGDSSTVQLDALREKATHFAGLAAIVFLSYKISIPILRGVGGLLFGKKKKEVPAIRVIVSDSPSEDIWAVVPALPPAIPQDMKLLHSCTLQCNIKDFYKWFVSGSSQFIKNLHIQTTGRTDYNLGPWHIAPSGTAAPGTPGNPDDGSILFSTGKSPFEFVMDTGPGVGGFVRNINFVQPKKPPQSVDAHVVQRQQFCVFNGDVLMVATAQNMLNIPFKDCFTVNTLWVARPCATGPGVEFSVYLKVNFLKGCIVGGIIRMTTTNENLAWFKKWGEEAAKLVAAGGPSLSQVVQPATSLSTLSSNNKRLLSGASAVRMGAGSGAEGTAGPDGSNSRVKDAAAAVIPVQRHVRVAVVFLLFLAGFVHQIVLRHDVQEVRGMILGGGVS
ncbi:hypothetical protein CEUSTIGMA_g4049.t1 [Chlamydomonas eustigma]|uniref:VASt domain-containing protein n=1 Tax=Chlamydomonas eustigma TaxID=1157962 RepID=A0A250X0J7_9CHLO|nr:hypothetical protein CEUSTIGMA_g4049.t1 [Chlamydomonas eustigma]|eukprot:GAX76603.1 hypothetical protein CEUSTIGMA_g4049.t1 [Chlamydomonas eustigma]